MSVSKSLMHKKNLFYYLKKLLYRPKWTTKQKIRLACYIDCDGSITIKGKKSYQTAVFFTNTDKMFVEYVKTIAQMGRIYVREKSHPEWKTQYVWIITSLTEIRFFLENIKQYLISKKSRAKLVLEFIESRFKQGLNQPYSEHEKEIIKKIKKLNRRGK